MFVTVSHFHPILIFADKERSLPFEKSPIRGAPACMKILHLSGSDWLLRTLQLITPYIYGSILRRVMSLCFMLFCWVPFCTKLWLPLSVLALRLVLTYLILLPVLLIFIWVTYNRCRCNKTFWHFFQDRPFRYWQHFSLVLKLSSLKI